MTAEELWREMAKVLGLDEGSGSVGRLGHGLGMQLTEWLLHMPGDKPTEEDGYNVRLERPLMK